MTNLFFEVQMFCHPFRKIFGVIFSADKNPRQKIFLMIFEPAKNLCRIFLRAF